MEEHENFQVINNCIDSRECVDIDGRLICVYYLYRFNEEIYALGRKQDEPGIIFNERLLDINKSSRGELPYNPVATEALTGELRRYYIDPVKAQEGKGFKMENEIKVNGNG